MISGNNGILTKVGEASESQKDAVEEEEVKMAVVTAIAKDNLGKLTDANLRETITSTFGDDSGLEGTGPWTYTGDRDTYQIDRNGKINIGLRAGLNVGDYVDYRPDGGTYPISRITTYSGSNLNGSDDLTLDNMGSLNWRILRIYDDGRIDLIGDRTSKAIYFNGSLGYNNGVYLMHDICETLYSNTTLGVTARSVNLEDMESWLTSDGKAARDGYITYPSKQYGRTNKYTGTKSYYPMLYPQEKLSGVNSDTVRTDGITEQDKYYTSLEELISIEELENSYDQASTNGLTVTQTYYSISITTDNYGEGYKVLNTGFYNEYWVASRCVEAGSNEANFRLNIAAFYLEGIAMFKSGGSDGSNINRKLRPVVSLGSDISITPCSGENDSGNPHTIDE